MSLSLVNVGLDDRLALQSYGFLMACHGSFAKYVCTYANRATAKSRSVCIPSVTSSSLWAQHAGPSASLAIIGKNTNPFALTAQQSCGEILPNLWRNAATAGFGGCFSARGPNQWPSHSSLQLWSIPASLARRSHSAQFCGTNHATLGR
jgi:hypothetical protein